ncbi:MAG TPA: CBS domain-containing protein [Beutenbergiaceae bacterium]|nr:CBS domain-containing protein [Beutenbergiaceae bacterium]
MRISEVLRRKGTAVMTIRPDATVRDMVRVLEENRIGALVVSEDEGKTLVGIISERDVVRELNRVGGSVLDEPVRNLMTTDVYTCVPEDELETLAHTMTEKRVRHLPVVVDGELQALVSIGDVVKHRIDELQAERDQLVDYVHTSYRST